MAAPAIGLRPRWLPGPSAQIDWSHPLAAGLAMLAVPSHRRDLATGQPLTQGGTTRTPSQFGDGESSFSSTAYWQIGSGTMFGPLAQFTILAAFKCSTATLSGARPVYAERATSGNDICKLDIARDGGSQQGITVTYRNDSGTLIQTSSTTDILGKQVVAGIVRTSATNFEMWIDGKRDGTASNGSMTATFTNANMQRRIGNDPASTSNHLNDAVVTAVFGWARALSAGEIGAFTADPFCMLRQ